MLRYLNHSCIDLESNAGVEIVGDEDQKAKFDQWKSNKSALRQQMNRQMLDQQLKEYERLYEAKMQKSIKFLNSPAFTSLPQGASPVVVDYLPAGRKMLNGLQK
jgi:hypothetical protein